MVYTHTFFLLTFLLNSFSLLPKLSTAEPGSILLNSLSPLQNLSTAESSDDIEFDLTPYAILYKNGTVQRFFGQERVPPSIDPITLVRSKDVKIHPNVSVRMFLPPNLTPEKRLPVLIYFHGGGFFSESAFAPAYHAHLNTLASRANVIAVSVEYRLAPENPLPTAYDDSWIAVRWTFSGADIWLKNYADMGRIYLGGDSAGGNIAHQMSIRIGTTKLPYPDVNVIGMFLNCPHFWGVTLLPGEEEHEPVADRELTEKIWTYAHYPASSSQDDPKVNPALDPELKKVGCKRVMVYGAGLDVLRFRGRYYAEELKKSGWSGVVKFVEVPGESHVFVLSNPTSPSSLDMIEDLACFLNH